MEGVYSNNRSKVPKLKMLNGNVSPINVPPRDNRQFLIGRYYPPPESPSFDSYASDDGTILEKVENQLIKYLRSGSPATGVDAFKTPVVDVPKYRHHMSSSKSKSSASSSSGLGSRGSLLPSPLSAIENLQTPPVFKGPVKAEEGVLVMDDILVRSASSTRARSSPSSDSGSSSSGSKRIYKREICRPWEDSGTCRYGSKCQFAHGKEELRPTRFPPKDKPEVQTYKSYTSPGSCTVGSKGRFTHHQITTAASPTEPAVAAVALATSQTVSPIKLEDTTSTGCSNTITCANADWSPQDDGIEVALSSSASTEGAPSREDVDAYIQSVLYSPIQRKRLPVFAGICPE